MADNSVQYAVLKMVNDRCGVIGNSLTGDILVKFGTSAYGNYVDNNMLGVRLRKIVDAYIIQQLGGPALSVSDTASMSEVTLTSIAPRRRGVMEKSGWQMVAEVYTYPTQNPLEAFMFECLIGVEMDKYIKLVRRRHKESNRK